MHTWLGGDIAEAVEDTLVSADDEPASRGGHAVSGAIYFGRPDLLACFQIDHRHFVLAACDRVARSDD